MIFSILPMLFYLSTLVVLSVMEQVSNHQLHQLTARWCSTSTPPLLSQHLTPAVCVSDCGDLNVHIFTFAIKVSPPLQKTGEEERPRRRLSSRFREERASVFAGACCARTYSMGSLVGSARKLTKYREILEAYVIQIIPFWTAQPSLLHWSRYV